MDFFEILQPAVGPAAGGLIALAAGYFQSRRANKTSIEAERRRISHDSAREITAELATLSTVLPQQIEGRWGELSIEGSNRVDAAWAVIRHHALYLSDPALQESVVEAGKYLLPPAPFPQFVGKIMPSIVRDIESWLGPRMQSHIQGKPMPPEPAFLKRFRSELVNADDQQREENERYDEWMAEERELLRAERAGDTNGHDDKAT